MAIHRRVTETQVGSIMLSTRTVNIETVDKEGDFPCPNCGATISPDDETNDIYSIIETKIKGSILEEIIILCRCGASLSLLLQ